MLNVSCEPLKEKKIMENKQGIYCSLSLSLFFFRIETLISINSGYRMLNRGYWSLSLDWKDKNKPSQLRNKPSCIWSMDLPQGCQGLPQWGKDSIIIKWCEENTKEWSWILLLYHIQKWALSRLKNKKTWKCKTLSRKHRRKAFMTLDIRQQFLAHDTISTGKKARIRQVGQT